VRYPFGILLASQEYTTLTNERDYLIQDRRAKRMLSIFEQKEFEQQPERKLTLSRLQTVLGPTPAKPEGPRPAVGLEEPPAAKPAAATAVPLERRPLPPPPVARVAPVVPVAPEAPPPESADPAIPAELQQFADQFARGFREVLVATVRDLQAPMVEDRRKMHAAFDFFDRTAKDLETLMSELAEATHRIDSLAKSLQELAVRNEKLEDTANIVGAAAHALEEAQQATERRLELQAGVIRGLNNAVQAREDRLDKFLSTFQALQGGASEHPDRRSLPENL
jgi:ABC-type transporter Mla subunit MlaD